MSNESSTKPTYDELVAIIKKTYGFILASDPDSVEVDRHELDVEDALSRAGVDTEAMQREAEFDNGDEDHEIDRVYDLGVDELDRAHEAAKGEDMDKPAQWQAVNDALDAFLKSGALNDLSESAAKSIESQLSDYAAELQNK